jgi:hypothetical protein
MPTKLRFVLSLPDAQTVDPDSVRKRFEPLQIALEALTKINEWHLRNAIENGNPFPRLYDAGIRYEEEPPGQEDWLDIPTLHMERKGDCEDLGCALTAERRVYDGVNSIPYIRHKFVPSQELIASGYPKKNIPREGIFLVHILSMLPDGTIEDPSKVLGMEGDY